MKGLNATQYLMLLLLHGWFCFAQQKSAHVEKINGKEYYIHTVKKGESLYGISKLYNTETEIILNENPIVKEKGLKAGQNLLIPVMSKIENALNKDTLNDVYHKVLKGQTVYSICKQYNITPEEFYALNPNAATTLKENDWVKVSKKRSKQSTNINTIKDTIISIKGKKNLPTLDKKTQYNIALLLPFGADNSQEMDIDNMVKNKQNFPPLSSMMIDFFKGLEYAVDSVKSDSFNIQLSLIDISEKDSTKLLQVMNTKTYKNADIIIGPTFSPLIKLEQNNNNNNPAFHIIPFVTYNKFLFNQPTYSKTSPSLYVDIEVLAHYIFDSLREDRKVVLLKSNANGDKEYAKEFQKYYNSLIHQNKLKDTIQTFKSITEFKKTVKDKQNYTVVLLTNNQVIATDYITQLSIINKTSPITLCGFYKTINFDNLDMEYLNQMKYVFTYHQNLNYHPIFSNMVKKYKQEFYTDPSAFFYEGFQIGVYYLNLIKNKGLNALYHLDEYPSVDKTAFMSFVFRRPDEETGFQNNAEYVYQIIDRKILMKRFQ